MTQRYRPYVLTDARLPELAERGTGGFVVMPDGKVVAVGECMHYRAIQKLFGDSSYHIAFRHGAIRVSFCGKASEFWIEVDEEFVTVKALRSLRRLMSYFNKQGRTEFSTRCGDPGDFNKASLKIASAWVSKTLLTRAKAERTKQQEEVI